MLNGRCLISQITDINEFTLLIHQNFVCVCVGLWLIIKKFGLSSNLAVRPSLQKMTSAKMALIILTFCN